MCLNGQTINVSRNACEGIKQAGGVCGPCPEPPASAPAKKKSAKAEKPS